MFVGAPGFFLESDQSVSLENPPASEPVSALEEGEPARTEGVRRAATPVLVDTGKIDSPEKALQSAGQAGQRDRRLEIDDARTAIVEHQDISSIPQVEMGDAPPVEAMNSQWFELLTRLMKKGGMALKSLIL